MIAHYDYQLALRTKALTLQVCTTGAISVTASSAGYTRASGSFVADGFAVGMEVSATGFSSSDNNDPKTITAVTATVLSCRGNANETATATLSVGLPALRAWENIAFTPIAGRPYVVEQYLPGPLIRESLGPFGSLEQRPMYVLHIYAVANAGLGAASKYADSVLTLFAPGTAIVAGNGDVLRVRSDVGPFRGQLVQPVPGWALVPVTIPCRIASTNSI